MLSWYVQLFAAIGSGPVRKDALLPGRKATGKARGGLADLLDHAANQGHRPTNAPADGLWWPRT